MLDRMSLSLKNGWKDQQGRYYITFPLDAVIAAVHCAREKANKLLKELESIGLLDRKRRGQGKANLLYLKHLAGTTQAQPEGEPVPLISQCKTEAETVSPVLRSSKIELQEVRKSNSRSTKTELQEVRKPNFKKFGNRTVIRLILSRLTLLRLTLSSIRHLMMRWIASNCKSRMMNFAQTLPWTGSA